MMLATATVTLVKHRFIGVPDQQGGNGTVIRSVATLRNPKSVSRLNAARGILPPGDFPLSRTCFLTLRIASLDV